MAFKSTGKLPFSRPYSSPRELDYLADVIASGHTQGDGAFTARAQELIDRILGADGSLLTTSCTHALELAWWILECGPGDEVIVPSFTFSSGAISVVQTGATPVFVDCDARTGNLDPAEVAGAIGPRTKAILTMHYAGAASGVLDLRRIADEHGLLLVEDNAHGLGARYADRRLGTIGDISVQSYHATKNVQAGEGGSIYFADAAHRERAQIIREKGTDRSRFLRGEVDKYSWVDRGSSYLPSELCAAVLTAQLEAFDEIQTLRMDLWDAYAAGLTEWAQEFGASVELMHVDPAAAHPAHMFFILMTDEDERDRLLKHLHGQDIVATFHYVPLHSSRAGRQFGRVHGDCRRSTEFSGRLLRLPLWAGMADRDLERVIDAVRSFR